MMLYFTYIGILTLLVMVMLFGRVAWCQRTPVGWLYDIITLHIPRLIELSFGRICGGSTGPIGRFFRYLGYVCCERPNPVLQIFYIALVCGGFTIYYYSAWKFLTLTQKIGSWSGVLITLATFAWVSNTDPGEVNAETLDILDKGYEYDNIIYHPKTCETCHVKRPPRTKHCRVCDRCVARFDHHCGWVNNCIGAYNVRGFILFLFETALLCTYCVYVCASLIYQVAIEYNLNRAWYHPRYGWRYVLAVLVGESGGLVSLGLFTLFISFMMYSFAGYHVWLVMRNTTTNETFKWSDAKEYRDYCQQLIDNPEAVDLATKKRPEITPLMHEWSKKQLGNIYHRGILANFFEVCCPGWFYRRAMKKKR